MCRREREVQVHAPPRCQGRGGCCCLCCSMAGFKRVTKTIECPKSMIGRVIGKNGETIKALQSYTGALIQIDQTIEPTQVTISGMQASLSLAVSMVNDIAKGTFKGFALLRQVTSSSLLTGVRPPPPAPAPVVAPCQQQALSRPVYTPGYGLIHSQASVTPQACLSASSCYLCPVLTCGG